MKWSKSHFWDKKPPDSFFTDPTARDMFKSHMEAVVNRKNTINGKVYKDDPAVFGWDLMNEPRCDCFPESIPVPWAYESCRPDCAKKVQVRLSSKLSGLN